MGMGGGKEDRERRGKGERRPEGGMWGFGGDLIVGGRTAFGQLRRKRVVGRGVVEGG